MLRKLLFSGLTVVGVFILFEISLRALALIPEFSPSFDRDDIVGYRLAPDAPGLNAGFNTLDAGKSNSEAARFMFIGDSFTFGTYPAQHVFPELVRKHLAQDGIAMRAVNRGLPGAGPGNYAGLVKAFMDVDDPDVVVVTLYLGNDVHQSHPRQETGLFLDRLATLNRVIEFGPNFEDFYVLKMLRRLPAMGWAAIDDAPDPLLPLASETNRTNPPLTERRLRRIFQRELEAMRQPLSSHMKEAELGLVARMEEIRGLTAPREVLIILAPSRIHVDEEFRGDVTRYWQLDGDAYCIECLADRLTQALQKLEFEVLDLTPQMKSAQAERDLFNRADTHWNLDGNRVAGEAVASWFLANPDWLVQNSGPTRP